MTEEPTPIAYTALLDGTPVQTSDGSVIGTVAAVLDVPDLDLFDGIVVNTENGVRFVDADHVASITTAAVHCRLTAEDARSLPEPEGSPAYGVDANDDTGGSLADRFGRMFGRGKWKQRD